MFDRYFNVKTVSCSSNPHKLVYTAMHQDYYEDAAFEDNRLLLKGERHCAELVVERLLSGHKGHFGCFEHPQITFNVVYFPHSVMQQLRTHRIGVSFDVQSTRYTGKRVIEVAEGIRSVEEVFYFRPVGSYSDRAGTKYSYDEEERNEDIRRAYESALYYTKLVKERGQSYEHARLSLTYNLRQHFVVSFNTRSLMHVLDLRAKKDAELEIQVLCDLLYDEFEDWMPETAKWYKENRWGKARLSP